MKVFWFDTETTGRDAVKNDIIQIAAVIEIDGEVKEKINLHCRPFDPEAVEPEALEVHGQTMEQILAYPDPKTVHKELVRVCGKYVNKYDKMDKFIPGGYNSKFDLDFLSEFFKKSGDKYFGSFFSWQALDPLYLIPILRYIGKYDKPNAKLVTVAEHYNLAFDAHDAFADIETTKLVFEKILSDLRE